MAAEAELPEPGDFVTVEVGPSSVIIVRDDDEEVRAFHNVCRHRGSRILDDDRGSVGNLVCPYHHWTYGVDGCLLHADNQPATSTAAASGSSRSTCAASPAWCSSASPTSPRPTSTTWRRASSPTSLPTSSVGRKSRTRVDLVEEGNWKLIMENNRECYHCDGHPELISAYFPLARLHRRGRPAPAAPRLGALRGGHRAPSRGVRPAGLPVGGVTRTRHAADRIHDHSTPRSTAPGSPTPPAARRCAASALGSIADDRFGDMHLHTQPNAWFHLLSDHAVVFTVLPLAPDRTLVRTTWLVHADAVEGVDYDVPTLTHVWRATNAQDSAFVARAQRGVEDPGYEPGPYSRGRGRRRRLRHLVHLPGQRAPVPLAVIPMDRAELPT